MPPRASLTDVVPKRTLVIIAVVVAICVIGAVLALTLGDDNTSSQGGKRGDTKSASAGATPGSSEAGGSTDESADTGSGTHTDSGAHDNPSTDPGQSASSGSSGSNGSSEGAGKESGGASTTTYEHSQGFSIGLPDGWKYQSTDGKGAHFAGPDGQQLLVAWTSTPKGDPVADWKNQEQGMIRSQYQRIRIEKVEYRGWNTADWEFTYVEGGTKWRSIDRGFVVSPTQAYALMYTAKAGEWDGDVRKNTWETLAETFQPKA